jgi:hypothetical protein
LSELELEIATCRAKGECYGDQMVEQYMLFKLPLRLMRGFSAGVAAAAVASLLKTDKYGASVLLGAALYAEKEWARKIFWALSDDVFAEAIKGVLHRGCIDEIGEFLGKSDLTTCAKCIKLLLPKMPYAARVLFAKFDQHRRQETLTTLTEQEKHGLTRWTPGGPVTSLSAESSEISPEEREMGKYFGDYVVDVSSPRGEVLSSKSRFLKREGKDEEAEQCETEVTVDLLRDLFSLTPGVTAAAAMSLVGRLPGLQGKEMSLLSSFIVCCAADGSLPGLPHVEPEHACKVLKKFPDRVSAQIVHDAIKQGGTDGVGKFLNRVEPEFCSTCLQKIFKEKPKEACEVFAFLTPEKQRAALAEMPAVVRDQLVAQKEF